MTGRTAPADVRVLLQEDDAERAAAVSATVQTVLTSLAEQLALPIEPTEPTVEIGDRQAVLVNDIRCEMPDGRYLLRHSSSLEDQVAQTIHLHAGLLITPEVANAVWAATSRSAASGAEPPAWFRQLLRELVRYRVRSTRLEPLLSVEGSADPADLFESALSAAGWPIRILVDEQTSRTWTEDRQELRALMSFLATGLSEEFGLPLPIPRLDVDPHLPDHHFAVEVGDLRTLAMPGIRSDQILVNDTEERLALLGWPGFAATTVINPATGQPASMASAAFSGQLQDTGLTVWTMSGYVVLTAAQVIRRHVAVLYRTEILRYQLDRLSPDHPVLRPMVEALGGVHRLTRILRRLLREQVPIDGLHAIVPLLYGAAPPPPSDPTRIRIPTRRNRADVVPACEVGDLQEASLAETARSACSRSIMHRYARGTATLVVYILGHEVERRLRDPAELTAEERLALLDMIADELIHLPPTAQRPVILTRAPIRARLRSVIELEQPNIAVLAFEELAGDLNIQPVARLSLPT